MISSIRTKNSLQDTHLLQRQLTWLGRYMRLRDGLRLAARTLWLPILALVLIELAARFWPIAGRHRWALIPLEVWTVGLILYTLLRPLSRWQIAHRLDRELDLKDRLATALELQQVETHPATGMKPHPAPVAARRQTSNLPDLAQVIANLPAFQLADALASASQLTPKALTWSLPRRLLGWAAGLLILGLGLIFLPNPMDAILAQQAAVKEAAQEQAELVRETWNEFERTTEPTSEEREAALRELEALMQSLAANPGDLEQALADLARTQANLRDLQSPAAAHRSAIESIAAQLTARSRGQSQASTDLAEAGQALTELAATLPGLDAEAQNELADSLEDLAGQAAATDADLAEALANLASAVRAGDVSQALNAAGTAQGALARAGQSLELQEALAAAQAALDDSRQQLAQAGQSPGQNQGQAQAQGQGQGQNQGQGQGQGQGQPGGGGGTNANQLPGATRSGVAADPTQPNRPAGLGSLDTVYAPGTGQHIAGDPEFVAGQQTDEGQTIVREEQSPQGNLNPSLVPYRDVYQDYATTAAEAIERERIPPEWRDYVRDYFSQLAPE